MATCGLKILGRPPQRHFAERSSRKSYTADLKILEEFLAPLEILRGELPSILKLFDAQLTRNTFGEFND